MILAAEACAVRCGACGRLFVRKHERDRCSKMARLGALLLALFCACGCIRAEVCPPFCTCYRNFGLDADTVTVDCRAAELFTIPYPLPNITSHL